MRLQYNLQAYFFRKDKGVLVCKAQQKGSHYPIEDESSSSFDEESGEAAGREGADAVSVSVSPV